MRCPACAAAQPDSAEFCAACGQLLASSRQRTPGVPGALSAAVACTQSGDWPGMPAPQGLRLRPGSSQRLTWGHAARWLLGVLLTIVLLGCLFTAMRLGPGMRCSGKSPVCTSLFSPGPNSPYTFPPAPPELMP